MFNIFFWKKETRFQKFKNKIKKITKIVGPGFVTGASDDDPSGIGTYSVAGAKYGLQTLWLVPFLFPLMFVIQEMCARIGIATGQGLAANMQKFFPKYILYFLIGLLFIANSINIGADISIMAASIKMLIGGSVNLWAIILSIIIILLQVFIAYHYYSKILLFLTLFLFAYVITAFMTVNNWLEVIKFTFIPHVKFNKDFIIMLTAFIGTTISPYLFFWQTSHEIEEIEDNGDQNPGRSLKRDLIKKMRIDTFWGMLFSQLIAFFIVVTCFATLYKNGITNILTAQDAAMALKPFAGNFSYLVFTLGIIGAGLLGIPVLAGSSAYALAQISNKKYSLSLKYNEAKFFYNIIIFSVVIGLLISFINISPIKALVYAAVVNGIVAVPIIFFIILLANKTHVMGEHKNSKLSNFGAFFTCIIMFLCAIIMFW
jgi:Mn2+/Fe2+ NRAMP family transporter